MRAQVAQAPRDRLVPRPSRTRLVLIPIAVVALLLAIPSTIYAFSTKQLSQAQASEAAGHYQQALDQYSAVQSVAGNPVSRVLLADLADRAEAGTAETHFLYGVALTRQARFADAESQLRAAVTSGVADWPTRGNAALADLYLQWGQALVTQKQFDAGIAQYRKVAAVNPTGTMAAATNAGLATAYAAYGEWFTQQTPPDYVDALTWYENLVRDYPNSPQGKQAQLIQLPQTLYNAALAFVKQLRYQEARDAMDELVTNYSSTSYAAQAAAALKANQPLTGRLILSDQSPMPIANRQVRVATKWRIVQPHTYDDSAGPLYTTTTDASGNFSIAGGMPPGQNYLITWWDPSRKTFVTTFLNADTPVNQITINPLEPAQITVATS
jgi:tetratricopeptide (TPR) repeat protein